MKMIKRSVLLALVLLGMSACGGGGTAVITPVQKKVTVKFNTVSVVAPAAAPLAGVLLTVQLPAGVAVSNACTLVGENGAQLVDSATLYTPATRSVTFSLLESSPAGIGYGAIADLTCDVVPGTTLKTADFPTSALLQHQELSSAGPAPIDLSGQIGIDSSVTFGY